MTLRLIDLTAFCSRNGVAHSRFGRDAVGDPRLISDMLNGRAPRKKTQAKILAYMAQFNP